MPMSGCRMIAPVSITTGGILESWGPEKAALRQVMDEVRAFAPRLNEDDYCVDVAFRSWHNFREPEFTGVQPGPVGRTQRRFIVWHSVPKGLEDPAEVRLWLTDALGETARLVREYLPRRSKAYPAAQLASEVEGLSGRLRARALRP
jgi:hypothetical protein